MTFKPFGKKYDFREIALISNFPSYLHDPIENWLWTVLSRANVVVESDIWNANGKKYVGQRFINNLQIDFREKFPQYWSQFIPYIFSDTDRTCNILAFCLQHFSNQENANELEYILSQGGSGYGIIKTNKKASEYDKGVYDLVDRVASSIVKQSKQALDNNGLLLNAWIKCYGRNPDYGKVVSECQDFLEGFLRDKYFPANKTPQLGKIINDLKNSSSKLTFKGESVLKRKIDILNLIDNVQNFRGMHKAGTGKSPSKKEAEYVLHTTIYIWNLHQK
ncbi:hypothetical protein KKE45_00520 [Patescibacteria group bacterium]|nr:hypothetical protein [Patescibacteria group bacterium]